MNTISKVLKARWPEDALMPVSRTDEFSSGLENLIEIIRKYKLASWAFALFVGFVFRYLYAIVKNSIFIKKIISLLPPLIDPFSETQMQILTVAANAIAATASSLISALLCGGLLVYLFRKRATDLGLWSACMFLVLGPRFLFFWQVPEIGARISILIEPIIAVLMLASAIAIINKKTNRITTGSTADRD